MEQSSENEGGLLVLGAGVGAERLFACTCYSYWPAEPAQSDTSALYNGRIVWKHPAALTEPSSRADGFRVIVAHIHTDDRLFSLSKYLLGKLTVP